MRTTDRRRSPVAIAAVIAATIATASAAAVLPTVEAKLEAVQVGGALFDVQVWARTNNESASFPLGDGGIKAFGFNVLSAGFGLAVPVAAAGTGPNATRVATQWDPRVSASFTAINPLLRDAPSDFATPDPDSDLDAIGGAFIDLNTFTDTNLGVDGIWHLIATERWQLTPAGAGPGERLILYVDNPIYYDFSVSSPGRQANFGAIVTSGAVLPGDGTALPPIVGDLNGDRTVNLADIQVVTSHWLSVGVPPSDGDVSRDGVVNQLDLNLIVGNWLATGEPAALSVVPEPAGLALCALVPLLAIGRRRRSCRGGSAARVVAAAATVVALVPAASSDASVIEAKLVAIKTAPSQFDVQVWVSTWNVSGAFPGGDGGIAGFQFDITSDGTGRAVPVADPVYPGRVQTTFSSEIISAFSTITPLRMDGVPALGHVSDGDVDALGGSIYDAGGYHNTTLGLDKTPVLVATQRWQLTEDAGGGQYPGDFLTLRLVGPTFYDYSVQTPGSIHRREFSIVFLEDAWLASEDASPLPGDLNGDLVVNLADVNLVTSNWLKRDAWWFEGDANSDGRVTFDDINVIGGNWLATIEPAGLQIVPEPAGMALCVLAAPLVLWQNRGRRWGGQAPRRTRSRSWK